MEYLKYLKIGDIVWHGGDSGFCYSSYETIQNVTYQYDQRTGKKYKILWVANQRFDSRDGSPLDPPLAYYIKPK